MIKMELYIFCIEFLSLRKGVYQKKKNWLGNEDVSGGSKWSDVCDCSCVCITLMRYKRVLKYCNRVLIIYFNFNLLDKHMLKDYK